MHLANSLITQILSGTSSMFAQLYTWLSSYWELDAFTASVVVAIVASVGVILLFWVIALIVVWWIYGAINPNLGNKDD